MKKLKKLRPQFDVKILQNLTQDATSCIEKLRTQHHLGLHPFHLNNIRDSIKDILDKGLSKYSKELDGILCGYHNINIQNYLAKLFDDSCFIHLDIEADFYIFKPAVGKTLHGVVNKISKDHIGCLVHKTFNVSIPKPARDRNWLGEKVKLGSEIILEIEHVDFDGLLPYIRGKLTSVLTQPEDSEEISTVKRAKKKKFTVSFSDDIDNSIVEEPPKKRKKKEKQNDSIEEYSEISEETEMPKKRKKSKSFTHTEVDMDESPKKHRNRSLSESDAFLSEKKLKKLKSENDSTAYAEDDSAEIVSKKKLKKLKSEMSISENNSTQLESESSETVSKKKHRKFKSEISVSENDSTHPENDVAEIVSKKKQKKIKPDIDNSENDTIEDISRIKQEYLDETEQETPSKKKKIKREVKESPKKKKVKRELDISD